MDDVVVARTVRGRVMVVGVAVLVARILRIRVGDAVVLMVVERHLAHAGLFHGR